MSPALSQSLSRALRLVLPLSALVLLATIFLVSRSIDTNTAAGVSGLDPTHLAHAPRIASARFAGVTDDATAMTISARSVRSNAEATGAGPLELEFSQPEGVLTFPDASTARFTASGAVLDQKRGVMRAQGPVALENSEGFELDLGALDAELDHTRLTARGGITGRAPAGEISADALELTRSGGPDGGYLLAFTGNVRLIYIP